MAKRGFWHELKRRHVYRVAVAYVVVGWLLIEVATQVFPVFHMPDWTDQLVVLLILIGFPIALVLAWAFDATPQGIVRTDALPDAADTGAMPPRRSRRAGVAVGLIGVLIALIAGGAYWHFGRGKSMAARRTVAVSAPGAAGAQNASTFRANATPQPLAANAPAASALASRLKTFTAFDPPKDSLVVLPFQNLSGDPKQQYFSDGITEELTGTLGLNPALKVIAWDTASTFRNPNQSATAIGKALNVADVLHGSIEREGNEVRISAELVDTRSGYELWSQHYDDSFANVFAVQDAVTKAIAGALQVKFAQVDLPTGGTANPEAHDLVLKGRALLGNYDTASLEAARKDFEAAIALDPGYADAHAQLSHTLLLLLTETSLSYKDTLPQARVQADKALALDPGNVGALVALGTVDAYADPPQVARARNAYRKALAVDPNNADAHMSYAFTLPLTLGLVEFQKAARLDPDSALDQFNLAYEYLDLDDWRGTVAAAESSIQLNPRLVDGAFLLAFAYQQLHQYDQMKAAFDLVKPATPLDQQLTETGRLVYQSVADPALRSQALTALAKLRQHQSNRDVAINLVPMYASLGERSELLRLLEKQCPTYPILCVDLAVDPMYAVLGGDPRFEQLAKRYTTVSRDPQPSPASSGTLP